LFTEKEVDELMNKIDADHSGDISFSEWVMTAVDVSKILNDEKLDAIFTMFDTSGDQRVSLAEIKGLLEACREIDDAMVDRAIKEFDGHGD
jgi:Ca2+-binding EF-hand superfamily protein